MSESNPLLLEYSGQLYDFAEIAYNEFVAMKAAKRSAVLNLTPTNVIPTSFKCKTGGFSETITKLSWIEELTTILILLFALPGAIFSLPILTIIIGHFISNMMVAVMILCCFIFPLHFYPISFSEDFLYSWISYLLMKYFSFRVVVHNDAYITKRKLFIVACPPHGVFPFGNILALITFPFIFGFSLRGLAANSALHVPIMGQLMRSFGVISANNEVAEEALGHGHSIGINTGGIAELFVKGNKNEEVIVMKNRKGMIKLAYHHGASIVPSFCFGNSESLSLWAGGNNATVTKWLSKISRKIGIALILFWGRFGLPIAFRTPILCVYGKPIPVSKKARPTDKDVEEIMSLLVQEEIKIFDQYKYSYGWGHKKLVVV